MNSHSNTNISASPSPSPSLSPSSISPSSSPSPSSSSSPSPSPSLSPSSSSSPSPSLSLYHKNISSLLSLLSYDFSFPLLSIPSSLSSSLSLSVFPFSSSSSSSSSSLLPSIIHHLHMLSPLFFADFTSLHPPSSIHIPHSRQRGTSSSSSSSSSYITYSSITSPFLPSHFSFVLSRLLPPSCVSLLYSFIHINILSFYTKILSDSAALSAHFVVKDAAIPNTNSNNNSNSAPSPSPPPSNSSKQKKLRVQNTFLHSSSFDSLLFTMRLALLHRDANALYPVFYLSSPFVPIIELLSFSLGLTKKAFKIIPNAFLSSATSTLSSSSSSSSLITTMDLQSLDQTLASDKSAGRHPLMIIITFHHSFPHSQVFHSDIHSHSPSVETLSLSSHSPPVLSQSSLSVSHNSRLLRIIRQYSLWTHLVTSSYLLPAFFKEDDEYRLALTEISSFTFDFGQFQRRNHSINMENYHYHHQSDSKMSFSSLSPSSSTVRFLTLVKNSLLSDSSNIHISHYTTQGILHGSGEGELHILIETLENIVHFDKLLRSSQPLPSPTSLSSLSSLSPNVPRLLYDRVLLSFDDQIQTRILNFRKLLKLSNIPLKFSLPSEDSVFFDSSTSSLLYPMCFFQLSLPSNLDSHRDFHCSQNEINHFISGFLHYKISHFFSPQMDEEGFASPNEQFSAISQQNKFYRMANMIHQNIQMVQFTTHKPNGTNNTQNQTTSSSSSSSRSSPRSPPIPSPPTIRCGFLYRPLPFLHFNSDELEFESHCILDFFDLLNEGIKMFEICIMRRADFYSKIMSMKDFTPIHIDNIPHNVKMGVGAFMFTPMAIPSQYLHSVQNTLNSLLVDSPLASATPFPTFLPYQAPRDTIPPNLPLGEYHSITHLVQQIPHITPHSDSHSHSLFFPCKTLDGHPCTVISLSYDLFHRSNSSLLSEIHRHISKGNIVANLISSDVKNSIDLVQKTLETSKPNNIIRSIPLVGSVWNFFSPQSQTDGTSYDIRSQTIQSKQKYFQISQPNELSQTTTNDGEGNRNGQENHSSHNVSDPKDNDFSVSMAEYQTSKREQYSEGQNESKLIPSHSTSPSLSAHTHDDPSSSSLLSSSLPLLSLFLYSHSDDYLSHLLYSSPSTEDSLIAQLEDGVTASAVIPNSENDISNGSPHSQILPLRLFVETTSSSSSSLPLRFLCWNEEMVREVHDDQSIEVNSITEIHVGRADGNNPQNVHSNDHENQSFPITICCPIVTLHLIFPSFSSCVAVLSSLIFLINRMVLQSAEIQQGNPFKEFHFNTLEGIRIVVGENILNTMEYHRQYSASQRFPQRVSGNISNDGNGKSNRNEFEDSATQFRTNKKK